MGTYSFPKPEIILSVLDKNESPAGDRTVPYIKITPKTRALANDSKGAFNKAVLKMVYEENQKIKTNGYNHRIYYLLNFSGDKWLTPIGEYVDDSDVFTFIVQAHNVNTDMRHLNDGGYIRMMHKYEEIVGIGSEYFLNVDENGDPVDLLNTRIALENVNDVEKFIEKIRTIRKRLIGNINWATDTKNTKIEDFYNRFCNLYEDLNKTDVSANADCMDEKVGLLKSCLNIFYYRWKINKNEMPDEFWNEMFNTYLDDMKRFNIIEDNETYLKLKNIRN